MDHLICIHYFLESLHFELSLLLIKLFITYKLVNTYLLKTIGTSYEEIFFINMKRFEMHSYPIFAIQKSMDSGSWIL